jgi:enoyl-[acyl-carrier protein] reductase I
MDDWLELRGKTVLVTGLANKKSVAWHVGDGLARAGANVVWCVHTDARREAVQRIAGDAPVLVCDVGDEAAIDRLAGEVAAGGWKLDGLVHSIAFADYSGGPRPFHATKKADFLRAVDVSCFSLVRLAGALEHHFAAKGASVVTLSISTTRMAAEDYGFMAPAKAALDSSVVFLAKSLAARGVRFNAVAAGLLKTSSSAGIPGYVESYLFAEQATLRKKSLETREVADAVLYLLSPRSSGINATNVVVDAGMAVNYFDKELVRRATLPERDA